MQHVESEARSEEEVMTREWPTGSRPQDPSFDGRGLKFETLEHGGDYPDTMPQEIRVTDEAGNSCIYVVVHPLSADPRL
jgi:hypothetical protein